MTLEMKVTRGEKSVGYFVVFTGLLLSVALPVIAYLNVASFWKVMLTVVSFLLIIYACFFSASVRNWIVGFMSKIEKKVEVFRK